MKNKKIIASCEVVKSNLATLQSQLDILYKSRVAFSLFLTNVNNSISKLNYEKKIQEKKLETYQQGRETTLLNLRNNGKICGYLYSECINFTCRRDKYCKRFTCVDDRRRCNHRFDLVAKSIKYQSDLNFYNRYIPQILNEIRSIKSKFVPLMIEKNNYINALSENKLTTDIKINKYNEWVAACSSNSCGGCPSTTSPVPLVKKQIH